MLASNNGQEVSTDTNKNIQKSDYKNIWITNKWLIATAKWQWDNYTMLKKEPKKMVVFCACIIE